MEQTGRLAWLARAVRPTPPRPRSATAGASSAFPVRPDCSVAVAARGTGADVAGRSSAALSPTPAPRRAVCSRRSCRVARSGSCRRTPGTAVSLRTEQRTARPGRFCHGLRSGRARSDQARPSDFTALLGEGPQVEIAEPDRPVAVIALGQRNRLFPHGLGQVELAVPPLDVTVAADPADLVVGRVLPHRDLFGIATR